MGATLTDIADECQSYGNFDAAYYRKMMHDVPDAASVDRVSFVVERCRNKRVFSLGATGPMQAAIDGVARASYATDLDVLPAEDMTRKDGFVVLDLDDETWSMPSWSVDLVVCGEVLEHLTNPGRVLKALKKYKCPVIITVPNAFGASGLAWVKRGIEHVNVDHVAWYSYMTLAQLMKRTGYTVSEWYWYNGPPMTAEGLIFVVE